MHTIGPYQIIDFIDSGSFGDVYRCIHMITKIPYACKIVSLKIKENLKYFQNFKNELRIHSQLSHSGIIQLHDVQIDSQNIYIILELCSNGNLEQLVQSTGGIDENTSMIYFKQIIEGIQYLHSRGVAHRDITLKNILISSYGTAKLSDFGLCKLQPENSKLNTTCGTFVYVPPEILLEKEYNGLKADIWSAGICLYAMTSNHLPWLIDELIPPEKIWEETKKQICNGEILYDEQMSPQLRDLLSQMLCTNPEYRPDAEEILNHSWFSPLQDEEFKLNPNPNPNLINLVSSLIENLEK